MSCGDNLTTVRPTDYRFVYSPWTGDNWWTWHPGNASSTAMDRHCAHCGRPVIGTFVQGSAGVYHPECCRSPYAKDTP